MGSRRAGAEHRHRRRHLRSAVGSVPPYRHLEPVRLPGLRGAGRAHPPVLRRARRPVRGDGRAVPLCERGVRSDRVVRSRLAAVARPAHRLRRPLQSLRRLPRILLAGGGGGAGPQRRDCRHRLLPDHAESDRRATRGAGEQHLHRRQARAAAALRGGRPVLRPSGAVLAGGAPWRRHVLGDRAVAGLRLRGIRVGGHPGRRDGRSPARRPVRAADRDGVRRRPLSGDSGRLHRHAARPRGLRRGRWPMRVSASSAGRVRS